MWSLVGCLSVGPSSGDGPPHGPGAGRGPEVVDGHEDPPDPPDLGDYDALLDPTVLHDVRLTIAPADIEALNADGFTFVPATFEHDGNILDVGVHLKGSSTYQDFEGKPAFRVKFDAFVRGQEYAGLERIALNNLTGDPASGREVVAYLAWSLGGHPAPRAALARVFVNEEYYGLYALVEGVDREWARRRFSDGEGDLWAADDNADLTPERVVQYELVAGEGLGPVTPAEASAALAEWSPDFFGQVDPVVDTAAYLDFCALSIATGGADGYPWHMNDYFLYANPAEGGRLVFAPWGQDETWSELWMFSYGGGVLGWKCEQDPACVAELNTRVEAALTALEAADLAAAAETLFSLSREAAEADPRSPYTPAEVEAARKKLVATIDGWPDKVRAAMGL